MCNNCGPARTAAVDQFFAKASADLTSLVDLFRIATSGGDHRITELDLLVCTLTDPRKDDGTRVSHESHVQTMAGLLAVAIERLARA